MAHKTRSSHWAQETQRPEVGDSVLPIASVVCWLVSHLTHASLLVISQKNLSTTWMWRTSLGPWRNSCQIPSSAFANLKSVKGNPVENGLVLNYMSFAPAPGHHQAERPGLAGCGLRHKDSIQSGCAGRAQFSRAGRPHCPGHPIHQPPWGISFSSSA